MAVKLFGFCKGTFDGLLAALVDTLAPRSEPVSVSALAGVGPDMAGDQSSGILARCAGGQQWTGSADCRIALVVAIPGTIRGGIGQQLTLRASVAVGLCRVGECLARHHAGPRRGGSAIAGDAQDIALFQPLREARGGVTGIQADRADSKIKPLPLAVQPGQIDDGVVDICGCGAGVGDDAELAVHGAVIAIEEAFFGLPSRTM